MAEQVENGTVFDAAEQVEKIIIEDAAENILFDVGGKAEKTILFDATEQHLKKSYFSMWQNKHMDVSQNCHT